MLKELREGAIEARSAIGTALCCLDFAYDDGDEAGVHAAVESCREKYEILRIYLNVILRKNIDLDDREAVLTVLNNNRAIMKDFLDSDTINDYDKRNVNLIKLASRHYDELIRKIEGKS